MSLAGGFPKMADRGSRKSRIHVLRVLRGRLAVRRPRVGRERPAADCTGFRTAQADRTQQCDGDGEQESEHNRDPAAHAGHGRREAVLGPVLLEPMRLEAVRLEAVL
ncbi:MULTISPECIES: hypothetical protein [unclassified Streptomyces]|uniref:hypothetical protein n=1 Tax=unclassified Streptomyces TaxID=2593676 RepID=UPI002473CCAC|nr:MULTISPECIES: hypothetical protein [unclassified Streptomyces]